MLSEKEKLALQFLRGERGPEYLAPLGLSRVGVEYTITDTPQSPIKVTAGELAYGIGVLSFNAGRLQQWASLILAAPGIYDLGPLEESKYGEAVLDILWDISSGSFNFHYMLELAKKVQGERNK